MAIGTPALYVACVDNYGSEESHVIALDPSDLSVRDTVTLPSPFASRLAMRPDGYRLWVAHPGANLISVLNANTFDLRDTIDFGEVEHRPYQMAIRIISTLSMSMSFPQVLVACPSVSRIYVYNMYTHHRLHELDVVSERAGGATPNYVKLDQEHQLLYAYSHLGDHKDSVCIIELGDNYNLDHASQIDEICFRDDCMEPTDPPRVKLQEATLNPNGTRLYIANWGTTRIEVVDTTTNAFLEPIIIEDYVNPRSLAISATGAYLYVGYTSQGYDEETEADLPGYLVMYHLEEGNAVYAEEIPGNPRTMVLNPSGDRLFVAEHHSHEIYAYDIDVEGESMSLAASINLDTVVDSGYANPVEVLYLERRYLVPYPYAQVPFVILFLLGRVWRRLLGFFGGIKPFK